MIKRCWGDVWVNLGWGFCEVGKYGLMLLFDIILEVNVVLVVFISFWGFKFFELGIFVVFLCNVLSLDLNLGF